MAVCSFCNHEIKVGTGILFVKRDGSTLNFCGSKCEKNTLKLGRKPSNQKWVTKKQ